MFNINIKYLLVGLFIFIGSVLIYETSVMYTERIRPKTVRSHRPQFNLTRKTYNAKADNYTTKGLKSDESLRQDTELLSERDNTTRPCNVGEFKQYIRLNGSSYDVDMLRQGLSGCTGVIYNRVPKCGSTTAHNVFRINYEKNKRTRFIISQNQYRLNKEKLSKYLKIIREEKHFILVSHHYYVNFTKYNNRPVVHINIIRQPVSWFVSAYAYFHYRNHGKAWWNSQNMSRCIADDKCVDYIVGIYGAVHFLCGTDPICDQPESAVQLAKRHVDQVYLLVGVTEDLDSFFAILQTLLPDLFQNLTDNLHGLNHRLQATQKDDLTSTDEIKLRARLGHEIEMYRYVRQKMDQIKRAIGIRDNDGRVTVLNK